MKRNVTVFSQKTYISANGTPTIYQHDLGLTDVLGQGKSLRVQVLGSRQSTTTARATLRFFESAKPGDVRPSQWGNPIGTVVVSGLRPAPVNINGPFLGRVECVLEIDDSAVTPAAQEFDLEVHITVIVEE